MDNIRIPVPAVDFHPPVYYCRRAGTALQPDGNLDKDFWADAPFTDEFIDIQGAHMPAPRFGTRVKILKSLLTLTPTPSSIMNLK